jgi:(p)ppGpp synthase/HD superfamily hydrolase
MTSAYNKLIFIMNVQPFVQELDWESIAAGLLHDTVEDTDVVTFERIEEEFGATVRHIVEGETKVIQ